MKALRRGFGIMCGGRALSLLSARDLHVMLCGTVDLDFAVLRESTTYDGFSPTCPVISWFWDVLEKFDTEQRRQFLAFVTGSDRVPISGLRSIKMCVQKNGPDSDRLPTSLTCFSRLLLPEYGSMEQLEDRCVVGVQGRGAASSWIFTNLTNLAALPFCSNLPG